MAYNRTAAQSPMPAVDGVWRHLARFVEERLADPYLRRLMAKLTLAENDALRATFAGHSGTTALASQ